MTEPSYSATTLANESRIVWLEDIAKLDYVRPIYATSTSRTGKPTGWEGGERRLVGYSELCATAQPTHEHVTYYRRVFYLNPRDRDSGDPVYRQTCPVEAVDPRTLAPGKLGEKTPRVRGQNSESKHEAENHEAENRA